MLGFCIIYKPVPTFESPYFIGMSFLNVLDQPFLIDKTRNNIAICFMNYLFFEYISDWNSCGELIVIAIISGTLYFS